MSAILALQDLIVYLDQYLDSRGRDYGPNGLQVEGKAGIRKIVTGVSACQELFVRAREAGADAVLVHHGIFWEGMPRTLTGFQYRRVAELIRGEMSLIAYHLPLDRHAGVGNNAVGRPRVRARPDLSRSASTTGCRWASRGAFPRRSRPRSWWTAAGGSTARSRSPSWAARRTVSTLGIISGGAQRDVYTAIDDGLDAYITGEVSEWVMNVAREAGIHYLAAGHYATERLGIRALGDHLRERFGLEVEFIDVPNPV